MSRVIYMDGKFLPESEAKISVFDLSVMQAAAAFEMTRSFNGVHFKLREHIARLEHSCDLLNIPLPIEWPQLFPLIDQLTHLCNDHGPGEEHRLLIVVSPGCAPMYKDLEGVIDHPFVYIADFPLRYTVKGFSRYFTEGVHCVTSTIQQVPDACVPSSAKHRSRLHFHLAQQQAPAGTWPLLTESVIYCEAPGANICGVNKAGGIFGIRDGALHGISMGTALDLMSGHYGFTPNLSQMRELWLTGTPFCALPVVSLDGHPIGDGQIGPKYKELMAKWNDLVGLDIQAQILEWDKAYVGKN